MSFVGKLLVFVQVALSLCFMMFAAAVYTVQTNWKVVAVGENGDGGLRNDVQLARTESENLQAELAQVQDDLNKQVTDATNRANMAEAENARLQATIAQQTDQLKTLQTRINSTTALNDVSSTEAQMRNAEAKTQRVVNVQLHKDKELLQNRNRALEDQIYAMSLKMDELLNKHDRVVSRMVALEKQAVQNGLRTDNATLAMVIDKGPPPPIEDGYVYNARKPARDGTQLVEVTLGTDDGLAVGHSLYVYRTPKAAGEKARYMGVIEVVHVTADKAVGKLVDSGNNGPIQRGDNVTTKL